MRFPPPFLLPISSVGERFLPFPPLLISAADLARVDGLIPPSYVGTLWLSVGEMPTFVSGERLRLIVGVSMILRSGNEVVCDQLLSADCKERPSPTYERCPTAPHDL